jgi:hypothetical protein
MPRFKVLVEWKEAGKGDGFLGWLTFHEHAYIGD